MTTIHKIIFLSQICFLISCGQVSDKVDSTSNKIGLDSTLLKLNSVDRQTEQNIHSKLTSRIILLPNNKIIRDSLTPFSYFDSIENLEQIEHILENSVNACSIVFADNKIKPLLSSDTITLGDNIQLLGFLKSPFENISYMVVNDRSELEYRNSIRIFSADQSGKILDVQDFSTHSGDGGDMYITKIKFIQTTEYKYIFTETHLADNETRDTISTTQLIGKITFDKSGQIDKTGRFLNASH